MNCYAHKHHQHHRRPPRRGKTRRDETRSAKSEQLGHSVCRSKRTVLAFYRRQESDDIGVDDSRTEIQRFRITNCQSKECAWIRSNRRKKEIQKDPKRWAASGCSCDLCDVGKRYDGCVHFMCLATNYCGHSTSKRSRVTTKRVELPVSLANIEFSAVSHRMTQTETAAHTYTPERHPNIQRPQNLYIFESHWKSNNKLRARTNRRGQNVKEREKERKKRKNGRPKEPSI